MMVASDFSDQKLTDQGLKNRYIQTQCANFTSTYKFALLLAITELSVEIGQDNGQPLAIPIRLLAEKTIELYWQQTLPYWTAQPDHNGIFWQNTSKQAAIINSVLSLRQAGCHSLAQARTHPDWASIVRQVGDTPYAPTWGRLRKRNLKHVKPSRVIFSHRLVAHPLVTHACTTFVV